MFAFTLLWYLRVNFLQYVNPSIIVCFPNSSVGLHPDAHFCVHKIYKIINNGVFWKIKQISSPQTLLFSMIIWWETVRSSVFGVRLFAAIHLFISSHNEIKDFCSMDKKTGRRYVRCLPVSTINIQFYREKARKKRWNTYRVPPF